MREKTYFVIGFVIGLFFSVIGSYGALTCKELDCLVYVPFDMISFLFVKLGKPFAVILNSLFYPVLFSFLFWFFGILKSKSIDKTIKIKRLSIVAKASFFLLIVSILFHLSEGIGFSHIFYYYIKNEAAWIYLTDFFFGIVFILSLLFLNRNKK